MTRSLLSVLLAALLPALVQAASSSSRGTTVRAQLQLVDPALNAPLTLTVPYMAQGLSADPAAVPTLTPLPMTLKEEGRTLWHGQNVQIELAGPGQVTPGETVPLAELRSPENGAFQSAVFTQVQQELRDRGVPARELRFTTPSMGAAKSARSRWKVAVVEELGRRFQPTAVNPNPQQASVLAGLFEGRIERGAELLYKLGGMDENIPGLLEASQRVVRTGGVLQDPEVHDETKAWILTTSALAAVTGAKPATRLFRRAMGAGGHLDTPQGVAELADVAGRISRDLRVVEANDTEIIVFDVNRVGRVLNDERANSLFRLWEDAAPPGREEAFRQRVERILGAPLRTGLRNEEGLLLGYPLTAVLDFAQRATRRAAQYMIQIVGDYGLDDIAWGTFEPLSPEPDGRRFRPGDNLRAMVWYDTVISLARRYFQRIQARPNTTGGRQPSS